MSWPRNLFRSLTRSRETGWAFACAGALVYVVYLIVLHGRHEAWRDEIHPWTIARMADGFWDIVTGDRVYDGHPPVWYWYLHLWTFITRRPWGLHAATIVAMGAAALLFLRYAPFPRPLKLLLLASYILGYEYGVLSRNYTLTWLLIVCFCSALHPLRPRFILLAILLVLLALTSVFGMFIACALFLMLVPVGLSLERSDGPPSAVTLRAHPRFLLAGAVLMLGLVFFVWSTKPPDPNYNSPDWNFDELTIANTKSAFHRLVCTFLPVRAYEPSYWTDFIHFWERHPKPWLPTGVALLVLLVLALVPGWFEIAGLLLGIGLVSVFSMIRWGGDMRHLGNMFLLFVGAAWVRRLKAPRRNHLLSTLLLVIIGCFQFKSFVVAARGDWKYAFSGGKAMAAWIEKAGLRDLPIVAGPDAIVLTVTSYLDRPYISSQSEEFNATQVFHARRRGFSSEALVERAAKEVKAKHRPVLVLSSYPVPASAGGGPKLKLLHQERSDVMDEPFWLYRMDE